jgi:hypothetical protein
MFSSVVVLTEVTLSLSMYPRFTSNVPCIDFACLFREINGYLGVDPTPEEHDLWEDNRQFGIGSGIGVEDESDDDDETGAGDSDSDDGLLFTTDDEELSGLEDEEKADENEDESEDELVGMESESVRSKKKVKKAESKKSRMKRKRGTPVDKVCILL